MEQGIYGAMFRVAQFEMQMRYANARAARISHYFSALDGDLVGAKIQIYAVCPAAVLLLLDVFFNAFGKSR